MLDDSLAALSRYRHEAMLQAVAATAKELLRSPDLEHSLPKVFEEIGGAAGVDRVHLFEFGKSSPSDPVSVLRHHVWSAPGVPTSGELQQPHSPIKDVGLSSWIPKLARGETIAVHVRNLQGAAREMFQQGGVKSVLAVPVFVEDRWWGLIGFDDCRSEHEWARGEIDTIKTLAELVGAAIARTSRQQVLADASRIIENSPTLLYRLSAKPPYSLVYVSQNVARYGHDAAELLASPAKWLQLIEVEDQAAIVSATEALASGQRDYVRTEFRLRRPDGSHVWFEAEGRGLRDGGSEICSVEGILIDITDRKHAAEKIAGLARIDSLTGLPNRAAFLERLQLSFARARRGVTSFAIHYLDLDHFKDVNDTLGHPAGDVLLQRVAQRLTHCVREIDLVARFGGDEFAVLQEDVTDLVSARSLAAKIGESLAAPHRINDNQVHATASIGVVPYREDIQDPDAMMMKADLALYRAKDEGRNQYRFHEAELDQQVRDRLMINEDLRLAVEREEFELHYQPQVELVTGQVVGLEALLRWRHPTRGLLLPSTFIPVAETTGSILAIGQWVVEEACGQISRWREQRISPPTVAVNVSAAVFKLANDFDSELTDCMARHAVDPQSLELELTETVLMETTQKYREALDRLRRIGVRLAIDDFGTGYSSLDYLRSFRVHRLKIDSRFVADVTTNPDDAAIVRATIGLARELGIEVVAEGVETEEQREFLMTAGCRIAQGYLLGAPIPVSKVDELLRRDRPFPAR